jgi:hypothetical protein
VSKVRLVVAAVAIAAAGGCTVFPAAPTFAPTQVLAPVDVRAHRVRPGHALVVVRLDAAGAHEMRGRLADPSGALQPSELRLAVPAVSAGVVAWEVALVPGRTRLTLDRAYSASGCETLAAGGAAGEQVGRLPCSVHRHAVQTAPAIDIEAGRAYFYGTFAGVPTEDAPIAMSDPPANVAAALRGLRPEMVVQEAPQDPPVRLVRR